MNKSKQIFLSVLLLALGIIVINSTLFSLPETSCSCYYQNQAATACTNYCVPLGSGCMYVQRVYSTCDGASCFTRFKIYCEAGYFSYWDHMEYCETCAYG